MGKNKQPDPEPEKIIRTVGENLTINVSEEERKYRNRNGPDDVKDISKDKLKCTVCMKSVSDIVKKSSEPFVHMVLGVLICKDCSSFYGDGYFSVDEDGDDKYCRWCGQGGTLYLCSGCTCAFCKKCIKQNLSKEYVKDLESDDWKCLICNPKPLYECRTICWALQEYAQAKKNSSLETNEEEDEEMPKSSRTKRSKPKSEPKPSPASRKRKTSEIENESEDEIEKRSKRRRISDTAQETRFDGNDTCLTPDRKSRSSRKSQNKNEESESEETRPLLKTPRKSQNKKEESDHLKSSTTDKSKKSNNKDDQSDNKSRRSSRKKSVEIVISDDNEEEDSEVDAKVRTSKSSSHRKSKSPKKIEKKPHSKHSKSKDVKKESNISSKKPSRNSSDKGEKKDGQESSESPKKRSQRSSRGKSSYKDESEEEDKSETNAKALRRKSVEELPRKSLTLSKNATKEVVQAGGFINSALKDVVELSNLILVRCEKLCSKSVQSTDDVLNVFSKLKQLTEAAHQNLSLIEKGLDSKITAWKSENFKETLKQSDKVDEEAQEEPDTNFNEEQENQVTVKRTDEEMEVEGSADEDKQKEIMDFNELSSENAEVRVSGLTEEKEMSVKPSNSIDSNQGHIKETDDKETSEPEETDNKSQPEEEKENDTADENPYSLSNETEDEEKSEEVIKSLNTEQDDNAKDNTSLSENKKPEESIEENTVIGEKEEIKEFNESTESKKLTEPENYLECKENVTEVANAGKNNVDKSESGNEFSLLNDSSEITSNILGANDLKNISVSNEESTSKINLAEEESKNGQDSKNQTEEENETIEGINTETEESAKEDDTQLPETQTELKNGSISKEKKESVNEDKRENVDEDNREKVDEEKKMEHKDEEKRKGEDNICRTPTEDHKSNPRPYQSSSGERNKYPQDSRWSGNNPNRDRGGWNRDRYQDRWSGGRGGSPYPRSGGDRWHRGGGGGWGGGYNR